MGCRDDGPTGPPDLSLTPEEQDEEQAAADEHRAYLDRTEEKTLSEQMLDGTLPVQGRASRFQASIDRMHARTRTLQEEEARRLPTEVLLAEIARRAK